LVIIFLAYFPYFEYIYKIILSGMTVRPLGTAAIIVPLYQPQMIDDGDYGVLGGTKFGRGDRSTRRKPALAPLCPQESHMTRPTLEPGPPRLEAGD
jgi:hypothetical protein